MEAASLGARKVAIRPIRTGGIVPYDAGLVGAQIGTRASVALQGEQLRSLLAVMVLAVCTILGYRLFATPTDAFTLVSLVAP